MTEQELKDAVVAIDTHIEVYCHVNKVNAYDLAEQLGLTDQTLRNRRRGLAEWKQSELMALSKITGLTIDQLVRK